MSGGGDGGVGGVAVAAAGRRQTASRCATRPCEVRMWEAASDRPKAS